MTTLLYTVGCARKAVLNSTRRPRQSSGYNAAQCSVAPAEGMLWITNLHQRSHSERSSCNRSTMCSCRFVAFPIKVTSLQRSDHFLFPVG